MPKESTSSKASKFYDSPINRRLRERINSGNISELSSRLGVTEAAVRQWQGGYTRPELDKVVAIAEFLGVSCDYLLGLTDTESPDPTMQAVVILTGLDEASIEAILNYRFISGDASRAVAKMDKKSYVSALINEGKCTRDSIQALATAFSMDILSMTLLLDDFWKAINALSLAFASHHINGCVESEGIVSRLSGMNKDGGIVLHGDEVADHFAQIAKNCFSRMVDGFANDMRKRDDNAEN
jgi:transcriptional regulator with XRE-family HTH domain